MGVGHRAAFSLACFLACACTRERPSDPAPAVSASVVPVAPVRRVTGAELLEQIRHTRKDAVLVNAWASWCGSCRHELPTLERVVSDHADRIELLLVSVDTTEDTPKALALLESEQLPKPWLFVEGRLGAFKQALNPEWRGVIPASFLFDRTGKLRYFWEGEAFEGDLRPVLDGFLAGQHIDGRSNFGLSKGAEGPRGTP